MIHRSSHKKDFTAINNAVLRDTRLSDGAARLLVFMLSMVDSWDFSTRYLAKVFGVSNSTIVARVTELKKAGYIDTVKKTDGKGHFASCSWEIFEEPRSEISAYGKNRIRKEPHSEKTAFGKISIIRNTIFEEIPSIEEISSDKKEEKTIKKTDVPIVSLEERRQIYEECQKKEGIK